MSKVSPKKLKSALSGSLAGLVNGFFGGGGGMVLVPLLTNLCGLPPKKAFATSVAIILPLCTLSALVYFLHGNLDVFAALPYLLGGLLGGFLGGKLYKGVSPLWLKRGFLLFLLYGAGRAMLC